MKKVIFFFLFSSSVFAWYGPGPGFGYGGWGGWGGYPYGAYGAMGYGFMIPTPSFNYSTVIQQSPPVIINNNDQPQVIERVIQSPPKIEYRYKPCDAECVRRYYSK